MASDYCYCMARSLLNGEPVYASVPAHNRRFDPHISPVIETHAAVMPRKCTRAMILTAFGSGDGMPWKQIQGEREIVSQRKEYGK